MLGLEAAHANFTRIMEEIKSYAQTIVSETDTRLKVVDRILLEVLGWAHADIHTESNAGSGFIDYQLTERDLTRLIIEAKKGARSLDTTALSAAHPYKLNGPAFKSRSFKEGLEQAIRYAAHKSSELACITNGQEWIVFRANRLGDGSEVTNGVAFAFPDLDSIAKHFKTFYSLLSVEAVLKHHFRALFQEAEGKVIRHTGYSRYLRDPRSRQALPLTSFAGDVDRVMNTFFQRLSGETDPELLQKCFVETSHSREADKMLARISEDMINRVRDLHTGSGEQLNQIIQRTQESAQHSFVVLIGAKGAGKSTFVDRFFRFVLPKNLRDTCVVARVNVADTSGDVNQIVQWLNNNLLKALETAITQEKSQDFNDVIGMYYDEYKRRSETTLKHLYESDKEKFKIDFGHYIEDIRQKDPHSYIKRLLEHAARSRKKLPVLVFDNTDHFSIAFQESVFQYAHSLYEAATCLVLLPITDRTSWQMARQGALRTYEYEPLYLPVPATKQILKRRIEFVQSMVEQEEKETGRGYFVGRGIGLTIDNLKAFIFCLYKVFVDDPLLSKNIQNLSNGDIRSALDIARSIISSPHMNLEDLLKVYIANDNYHIQPYRWVRSLVKGRFNLYPDRDNKYVRNVFHHGEKDENSPLIGVRILALLDDHRDTSSEDPFITVHQVCAYMQAMGIEDICTLAWLDYFLHSGLVQAYDPTIIAAIDSGQVQITLSGHLHYSWVCSNQIYLSAVMEVTPIMGRDEFETLNSIYSSDADKRRNSELSCAQFLRYLEHFSFTYVRSSV